MSLAGDWGVLIATPQTHFCEAGVSLLPSAPGEGRWGLRMGCLSPIASHTAVEEEHSAQPSLSCQEGETLMGLAPQAVLTGGLAYVGALAAGRWSTAREQKGLLLLYALVGT